MRKLQFQERAVKELKDAMAIEGRRDIVFESPTGSGKTIMLTRFMSEYMKDHEKIVFVWLSPGKGGLAEQSKAKMDKYCHNASTKNLEDVMTGGFQEDDAVFINWEKLTKEGNNALKDSERTNFIEWVEKALLEGLKFKIIVDESHQNDTAKADAIVGLFKTDKIIRASATPTRNPNAIHILISDEEVIAEGLIKKVIHINPGFPMQVDLAEGETHTAYLLEKAYSKWNELHVAFNAKGVKVNPLIVVQLPNSSDALLQGVEDWFATKHIDCENGRLAIWLANRKDNLEGIAENDAPQVAVVIKQAVATGWDCPRAHILVKLRENMDETFEIQTIGRIRRMPEACHYNDDAIDGCYLYTFDQRFTAGVIGSAADKDVGVKKVFIKQEHKAFSLVKEQRTMVVETRDPLLALKAVGDYLQFKYKLTGDKSKNKKVLEANGYIFKDEIRRTTYSGDAKTQHDLKNVKNMNEVAVWESIRTHKHGREFHHEIGEIGAGCALPYDDARQIVFRVFGSKPDDIHKKVRIVGKELYSFVINNSQRIKEDFLQAMTSTLNLTTPENPIAEKEFRFPQEFLCAFDTKARNQDPFLKNVYKDYLSSAATARTRSKGEVKFERWCEKTPQVEWWYRNGDKGDEFFSIVYEDNSGHQRLFFPDYILSVGGVTWIVEVKGGFSSSGESENIDEYASKKAAALKSYSDRHKVRGGFYCFDEGQEGGLLFEGGYSREIDDPGWKTVESVFR